MSWADTLTLNADDVVIGESALRHVMRSVGADLHINAAALMGAHKKVKYRCIHRRIWFRCDECAPCHEAFSRALAEAEAQDILLGTSSARDDFQFYGFRNRIQFADLVKMFEYP